MSFRRVYWILGYLVVTIVASCGRGKPSPPSAGENSVTTISVAKQTTADSTGPTTDPVPSFRFRDVAEEAGIRFGYYNAAHGRMNIRETMGGGVAVIDCDADGRPDLFFTDGCDLPRDPSDREHRGRLFRNRGDWSFEDITDSCGVSDLAYGQGCAVGDFDNDGFDDLCVTHYGSLALYHNNGDGTFHDLTDEAGIGSEMWCTAAAFGDLSGSGRLDLFVTGYLQVGPGPEPTCRDRRGTPTYCGPENFAGQSFRLFQNRDGGRFTDVSDAAGVVVPRSKGLAAAIFDIDLDGKLDVFAVNDAEPARLFRNVGGCRFDEVALTAGLAYTGDGQVYNGMGIAHGDYDGDGRLDLAVSNFYEKGVVLFRNRGGGLFRDASVQTGVGPATRTRLSFGLQFLDADNDGRLELFVANGHISDLSADGIPYAMSAQFFHHSRSGRLRDISAQAGDYFQTKRLGRGVAVADLDDDGRSDVAISHNTGPVSILRNETPSAGQFLSIELIGTNSSRTPFGAQLTATIGDKSIVRVLAGGGSYLSASDRRIVLGLATSDHVNSLEVSWPSGRRDRLKELPAGNGVRLIEVYQVGDLLP